MYQPRATSTINVGSVFSSDSEKDEYDSAGSLKEFLISDCDSPGEGSGGWDNDIIPATPQKQILTVDSESKSPDSNTPEYPSPRAHAPAKAGRECISNLDYVSESDDYSDEDLRWRPQKVRRVNQKNFTATGSSSAKQVGSAGSSKGNTKAGASSRSSNKVKRPNAKVMYVFTANTDVTLPLSAPWEPITRGSMTALRPYTLKLCLMQNVITKMLDKINSVEYKALQAKMAGQWEVGPIKRRVHYQGFIHFGPKNKKRMFDMNKKGKSGGWLSTIGLTEDELKLAYEISFDANNLAERNIKGATLKAISGGLKYVTKDFDDKKPTFQCALSKPDYGGTLEPPVVWDLRMECRPLDDQNLPHGPPVDFLPWQKEVLKYIGKFPHRREILWIWSKTHLGRGIIGKSSLMKHLASEHNLIQNGRSRDKTRQGSLILSGAAKDVTNGLVQYKAATGGKTPWLIMWNLPKSKMKKDGIFFSYAGAEVVKDMCFFCPKYGDSKLAAKAGTVGTMVSGWPPHLIIFANCPPQSGFSDDRICNTLFEIVDSKLVAQGSGYGTDSYMHLGFDYNINDQSSNNDSNYGSYSYNT